MVVAGVEREKARERVRETERERKKERINQIVMQGVKQRRLAGGGGVGAVNWRQHLGVRFLGSESVAFHASGAELTHKIEYSPPAFPKGPPQ